MTRLREKDPQREDARIHFQCLHQPPQLLGTVLTTLRLHRFHLLDDQQVISQLHSRSNINHHRCIKTRNINNQDNRCYLGNLPHRPRNHQLDRRNYLQLDTHHFDRISHTNSGAGLLDLNINDNNDEPIIMGVIITEASRIRR